MTHNISRRSLAKGAAWVTPAVVATTAIPAYAASSSSAIYCPLTDEQLNAGYCGPEIAMSWNIVGARSYSNSAGALVDLSTANNLGFQSDCNYRGLINFKIHNRSGEKSLPEPTITLTDGTVYTGDATLGNVGGGGAKVGFDMSITIQWNGLKSGRVGQFPDINGAVVKVPMQFNYTSPNGTLGTCYVTLSYVMTYDYDVLVHSMSQIQFTS